MKLLPWLDQRTFLKIRVWDFGGHSLLRAYGTAFLTKAVLRHPVKAICGLRKYQRLIQSGLATRERYVNLSNGHRDWGKEAIVGLGFCLKPLAPACVSGRANHNCHFFEHNLHLKSNGLPPCCAVCQIRQYGLLALRAGCDLYIMTSAIDILHDVFLPALDERKYQRGLFALCRYSFDPFVLPLLMADMEYALIPFDQGDCRDYATWLKADVGIKEDQTVMIQHNQDTLEYLLAPRGSENKPVGSFQKVGHVFRPS